MKENNEIVAEIKQGPVEKIYKFRKLTAKDIPAMLKILKKIQINKFADCFQSEAVQKLVVQAQETGTFENLNIVAGSTVFLEIAQIIINGVAECGEDIFKLLADVSNLTVEEIEGLDFDVFTQMVIDFVKKEEFVGFIKAVSKLIK